MIIWLTWQTKEFGTLSICNFAQTSSITPKLWEVLSVVTKSISTSFFSVYFQPVYAANFLKVSNCISFKLLSDSVKILIVGNVPCLLFLLFLQVSMLHQKLLSYWNLLLQKLYCCLLVGLFLIFSTCQTYYNWKVC